MLNLYECLANTRSMGFIEYDILFYNTGSKCVGGNSIVDGVDDDGTYSCGQLFDKDIFTDCKYVTDFAVIHSCFRGLKEC